MKKFLIAIISLLTVQLSIAQPGGAKIRFSAKKSSTQANQFQIYAKNVSASTISGNLGASLLSLCLGVPISVPATLTATISSPIAGQTFAVPLVSDSGTTRIYTWNGTGSTGTVVFDPNVEVLLATVTFNGVAETRPVKLMNVRNQGPSFFDNNFIAPNGVDQCDYSNPFYSPLGTSDVNLRNCGGTNDLSIPSCTSTFTVADVVLPTKFLSFYANKSDDNAKLTWTVDNEEDNSYFEVEASTDARSFATVQKVDALRNGRSSNTYNLTDSRISRYNAGIIYYRIKQVEASGRIIYSDVRQVTLDGKNFVAALYPNPVKTVTKLVIEAPEAGKASVIIRDATGKAVKQMNLQLQKGTNQQEIDASILAAGDYNVTIVSDKMNQTIKMTKSN